MSNDDEYFRRLGSSFLAGLGGPPLSSPLVAAPTPAFEQTTSAKLQSVRERFGKRLEKVNQVLPIRSGRVVPNEEDMFLGDARRITVAVLFLDICGFSKIPSNTDGEQDTTFKIINLFMSEMLHVVRAYGGYFEKNTGDGLMAYFQGSSQNEIAKVAVEVALTMHCYNDQVLASMMVELGLPRIDFRIGIETGIVTVAKVGVRGGDHHSLVAIGATANVACKLMNLIPDGGIVIGAHTKAQLPSSWTVHLQQAPTPLPDFVFIGTNTPYTAFLVTYRIPDRSLLRTFLTGWPS